MSEEEIIDMLIEIKNHQVAFFEPKENIQILRNYFNQKQREAIQGILDLYNKEKEKNKELEIESLDKNIWKNKYIEQVKYGNKVTLDGDAVPQVIDIIKKNYISKDKIIEKIEELGKKEKEELKGTKGQDRYNIKQEFMFKKNILQELLEERK